MFREMRRKGQQLSNDEIIKILKKCTSGVLSLFGDNGYPYAVPLSYVYLDGKIYFHSAKEGHKIDAIKNNDKASFCVIEQDNVVPEKYTTAYRSVTAFGRVKIVDDDNLKRTAIEKHSEKYTFADKYEIQKVTDKAYNSFCVIEFDIEYMTGKEGLESAKRKA